MLGEAVNGNSDHDSAFCSMVQKKTTLFLFLISLKFSLKSAV